MQAKRAMAMITEPVKLFFFSEIKINPVVKKTQNYANKLGYDMFGERTETDRLPHLTMKYEPCGKRNQSVTSKYCSTSDGTGTGHEV